MKKLLLSLIAIALTATLCAQAIYPAPEWKRANPAKYGFDAEKLQAARQFVIDSTRTTGLMVVVGGEVIFQYGCVRSNSRVASVRKSILSMMFGKYIENGTINMSLTMADLGIDDVEGLLPIEKQATIAHLIASRSGVYHEASNSGSDEVNRPARGTKQPGEFFLYNNWDFNAIGAIFEQLVGRDIYDVFQDDIAIPIGMQDYNVKDQRKSGDLTLSRFPAYHFYLSTRDKARIGYLMLREGKWGDTQVISTNWVRESIRVVTPKSDALPARPSRDLFGYSYMWWNFIVDNEPALEGAYTAWGWGGQYITIVPKLDMVISHKTDILFERRTSVEQYYDLLRMIVNAKK